MTLKKILLTSLWSYSHIVIILTHFLHLLDNYVFILCLFSVFIHLLLHYQYLPLYKWTYLFYSIMLHVHVCILFIYFSVYKKCIIYIYICIQQYKTMYILLPSFYVSSDYYNTMHRSSSTLWYMYMWLYIGGLNKHISQHFVVHVDIYWGFGKHISHLK